LKCAIRSARPIVPPFTLLVTAVTVASSAPLSQIDQRPFELKKNAAEARGYLVATTSVGKYFLNVPNKHFSETNYLLFLFSFLRTQQPL
jgi:hypothetical protein